MRRRRQPGVSVQLRDRTLAVSVSRVTRAAHTAQDFCGQAGTPLSVIVVGDEAMRALNRRHAGIVTTTDVLAFDLSGGPATPGKRAVGSKHAAGDEPVAGEVIVNATVAAAEAARRGREAVEELLLYVVHGVLHLGGYRDHTPAEKRLMRAAEANVMRTIGKGSKP